VAAVDLSYWWLIHSVALTGCTGVRHGRPERSIDPAAGPIQRFAAELRQLRRNAGRVSHRELSRRVKLADHTGMPAKSLRDELAADSGTIRLTIRRALADEPETAVMVILVDQFEEVFTLCRDEEERAGLIAAVLAAADGAGRRARIILGMRADFYARCAEYPALVTALRDHQLLVGAADENDLRQAVTGPAAAHRCPGHHTVKICRR
jgi:hypothetical protein